MSVKDNLYFESANPVDTRLKDYIDYYYFQNTLSEDYSSTIVYYPHHKHALNIYQNAKVTWDNGGRTIKSCEGCSTSVLYTTNKDKSRYVTMQGVSQKVGIIFKPLGINQFIEPKLDSLINGTISEFDYFGADFIKLGDKLQTVDLEEKIKLMDEFFMAQYKGFSHPILEAALNLLLNPNETFTILEIAGKLKTNRKTITRLFKAHITYTPKQFKAILKFRNALDSFQKGSNKNFTEIAYESGYYDQSDYINSLKNLVGKTPKELYQELIAFGEKGTFWTPLSDEMPLNP